MFWPLNCRSWSRSEMIDCCIELPRYIKKIKVLDFLIALLKEKYVFVLFFQNVAKWVKFATIVLGTFCGHFCLFVCFKFDSVWFMIFPGNRTAWILPFSSGGFIYVALVTVVPDLLKETCPWWVRDPAVKIRWLHYDKNFHCYCLT